MGRYRCIVVIATLHAKAYKIIACMLMTSSLNITKHDDYDYDYKYINLDKDIAVKL